MWQHTIPCMRSGSITLSIAWYQDGSQLLRESCTVSWCALSGMHPLMTMQYELIHHCYLLNIVFQTSCISDHVLMNKASSYPFLEYMAAHHVVSAYICAGQ